MNSRDLYQSEKRSEFDPAELWTAGGSEKRKPDTFVDDLDAKVQEEVVDLYSRSKSPFWAVLASVTPDRRSSVIRRLFRQWPVLRERYAMLGGQLVVNAAPTGSCLYLGLKIRENFNLTSRLPKYSAVAFPTVLAFLVNVVLTEEMINKELIGFEPVSLHKFALKQSFITVGTGVVFPVVSTPFACLFMAQQAQLYRVEPRTITELVVMIWLTTKHVFLSRAVPLAIGQVALAYMAVGTQIWGRSRILPTLVDDPEIFEEFLESEKGKPRRIESLFQRVREYFAHIRGPKM